MDFDILIFKNVVDILFRSLYVAVVPNVQNSKSRIYFLTATHVIISRVLSKAQKMFLFIVMRRFIECQKFGLI
jgi:hypothetical protein